MARVPSVAQTEQTFRPLAFAVRILLVTGRCCPNCGSPEIRPSNRRNALDVLLACVFLAPFRCRVCRDRFYRLWRPSLQRPPDPPIAPLVLVPVQNQLLNLDFVEPRRQEPEPIHPRNGEPASVQLPRSDIEARKLDIEARKLDIEARKLDIEARGLDIAAPAPVESTQVTTPLEPTPTSTPVRILILEDDLSIRKLLRRLLERRGHLTVEISQAGDIAKELLGRGASLLIVDVAATGANNVDAVVAMASAHPRLKILALSAESLQGSEIPGRLLALPKPFPLDSFIDCVEHLPCSAERLSHAFPCLIRFARCTRQFRHRSMVTVPSGFSTPAAPIASASSFDTASAIAWIPAAASARSRRNIVRCS